MNKTQKRVFRIIIILLGFSVLYSSKLYSGEAALNHEEVICNKCYSIDNKPNVIIRIINDSRKSRRIKYYQNRLDNSTRETNKRIKANTDFRLELSHNLPYQSVQVYINNFISFELIVNEDLNVTIDAQAINNINENQDYRHIENFINFSGVDSSLQVYFNNFYSYYDSDPCSVQIPPWTRALYYTSLEDINREYHRRNRLIEEFSTDYPSDYSKILHNEAKTEYYLRLLNIMDFEELQDTIRNNILSHTPMIFSWLANTYYTILLDRIMYTEYFDDYFDWTNASITVQGIPAVEFIESFNFDFQPKDYLNLIKKFETILEIQFLTPPHISDYLLLKMGSYNEMYQDVLNKFIYESLTSDYFKIILNERIKE